MGRPSFLGPFPSHVYPYSASYKSNLEPCSCFFFTVSWKILLVEMPKPVYTVQGACHKYHKPLRGMLMLFVQGEIVPDGH